MCCAIQTLFSFLVTAVYQLRQACSFSKAFHIILAIKGTTLACLVTEVGILSVQSDTNESIFKFVQIY